ncbi:MAG: AmmeMemoRadiSam system protein A [Deltaproteobacteria bacterium]|nr:AmmeMemoRadiSam system protein A [Deltaproteobacteria bacterium]MCL4874831.1 AmmeMemoRadiSam system protein A [bacterium]
MPLNDAEKKELLLIARVAIEARARRNAAVPRTANASGALNEDSGAFVTINRKGRLRGCIGVFASKDPLWKTVERMAGAAAAEDPRFVPIGEDELPDIEVEISVLTPLRKIDDPEEVEVGRHGLVIALGNKRGALLPQVAIEHGFDRETFLSETCVKAGLKPEAWKEGASIYVFEAEVFGEKVPEKIRTVK